MLRTESNGSAPAAGLSFARLVSLVITGPRECRHPGAGAETATRDANGSSPTLPFGLARQLDRRHFLELDRAVLDEIVERRVGRTRDLHAVEVHGERGPMIGVGPGRGQADALHAGRHPALFLTEA